MTAKKTPAPPPTQKIPTATTKAAMLEARAMGKKSMLQQAHDTIHGARQADYGDKLQNFSQIAMIWQGLLAHKLGATSTITPEDVALCMIGVKMSRLAKSPDHFDSILDIAGYAGCYAHLQDERTNGVELAGAIFDPRQ